MYSVTPSLTTDNVSYFISAIAPKGVEWKTWDGKKVPMKEDDCID
jgi:hypothetical protein